MTDKADKWITLGMLLWIMALGMLVEHVSRLGWWGLLATMAMAVGMLAYGVRLGKRNAAVEAQS